ncbi:hypothetical protein ACVWXO_006164 [Bradyrhizobium sp. LM2.7]
MLDASELVSRRAGAKPVRNLFQACAETRRDQLDIVAQILGWQVSEWDGRRSESGGLPQQKAQNRCFRLDPSKLLVLIPFSVRAGPILRAAAPFQ